LFTPTASIGLRFEQLAERQHAQVIHTRGWADSFGPISLWQRIHDTREYGVLSCDQQRYVLGMKIMCTDIAWVGSTGDPVKEPHLWTRFSQAMSRGIDSEDPPRLWMLPEDAA
jgi:hypothetical protein